jgi:hypothetical protein
LEIAKQLVSGVGKRNFRMSLKSLTGGEKFFIILPLRCRRSESDGAVKVEAL